MLCLIAAVAENGVIGRDNRLPWRIPEDLRRFRAITLGHPVVMGRRTWDSLGKALPGRANIVVSANPDLRDEGAEAMPDLATALARARALAGPDAPVFVIGGARLYAEALPLARRLYLTRVHRAYPGDAFFPAFDAANWREVEREDHPESDPPFSFLVLERP